MGFSIKLSDSSKKKELTLRRFVDFLLGEFGITGRFIDTQRRLVDIADKPGYTFSESDLSRALSKTFENKKAVSNIKEKILAQLEDFSTRLASEILKVDSLVRDDGEVNLFDEMLKTQIMESFIKCLEEVFEIPKIVRNNLKYYHNQPAEDIDLHMCLSRIISAILVYTCTPKECIDNEDCGEESGIIIRHDCSLDDEDTIITPAGGVVTKPYMNAMIRTILSYEKQLYLDYDYKKVDIQIDESTGLIRRDIEVVKKIVNPGNIETVFETIMIFHSQKSVEELLKIKYEDFNLYVNGLDFIDYLKTYKTKKGDELLQLLVENSEKGYTPLFKINRTNTIADTIHTRTSNIIIPIPEDLSDIEVKYTMTSWSNPAIESIGYTYRLLYPCNKLFHEWRIVDSSNWILMNFLFPSTIASNPDAKKTNLNHYGPDRSNCTISIGQWQPPGSGYMMRVKNRESIKLNQYLELIKEMK